MLDPVVTKAVEVLVVLWCCVASRCQVIQGEFHLRIEIMENEISSSAFAVSVASRCPVFQWEFQLRAKDEGDRVKPGRLPCPGVSVLMMRVSS